MTKDIFHTEDAVSAVKLEVLIFWTTSEFMNALVFIAQQSAG